jgi:hypothetical protein
MENSNNSDSDNFGPAEDAKIAAFMRDQLQDFLKARLPKLENGHRAFVYQRIPGVAPAPVKPTPEEHAEVLRESWLEVIKNDEVAAWGIASSDVYGDLAIRPHGELKIHKSIPPKPETGRSEELVVLIHDPRNPKMWKSEPNSFKSADLRLESDPLLTAPPEWTAGMMDRPFVNLDRMADFLHPKAAGDDIPSGEQIALRRNLERHLILAWSRAFCLLPKFAKETNPWGWMAFVMQCMSAVSAYEKLKHSTDEVEDKRGRKALLLRRGQEDGREPDEQRKEHVAALSTFRKQGLKFKGCLDELERLGKITLNAKRTRLKFDDGTIIAMGTFRNYFTEADPKNSR